MGVVSTAFDHYAKETSLNDTSERLELRGDLMKQNFEASKTKVDHALNDYSRMKEEIEAIGRRLTANIEAANMAPTDRELFFDPVTMAQMVTNIRESLVQFEQFEISMITGCQELNLRVKSVEQDQQFGKNRRSVCERP